MSAFANFQYVTLVARGGTPVRLCNRDGTPYATTGTGAIVFSDGATLSNVTLNGYSIGPPLFTDNGTVSAPSLYFTTTDRGLYSRGANDISVASGGERIASFGSNSTELEFSTYSTGLRFGADIVNDILIQGYADDFATARAINVQKYGSHITVGSSLANVAGGSVTNAAIKLTSAGVTLLTGTGAPTVAAAYGSLYMRQDSTALPYFNTDASTTWQQLVGVSATQTLTNKTLTAPVITGGSLSSPTITGTVAGGASYTSITLTGTTTVSGGTVTASTPMIDATQVWNNVATNFSAVRINITNTASAYPSYPFVIRIGGNDWFTVDQFGGCFANGALGTTGAITGGVTTITSANASALAVGLNGATNPAFRVDSSVASQASGVLITAGIAAVAPNISVISSDADVGLNINAKGSGGITLGGTSTGAITLTRATTLSDALTYGGVTLANSVTGTGSMVLSIGAALTGTPTAPTATVGTSTTQIATTEFVNTAVPTGTVMHYVGTTAPSGWLLLRGGTIGNASSGGTIRANADTVNLFTLLWNSMANAEAPVSGGRGANAAADYAANKTITLPDISGRVIAGVEAVATRLTSGVSGVNGALLGGSGGDQRMTAHTHTYSTVSGSGAAQFQFAAGAQTFSTFNTGSAGGGASENVQPTYLLNHIIKL